MELPGHDAIDADFSLAKFEGKEATNTTALIDEIKKKKPGDEVTFEIHRGTETLTLKVVLGRKQGTS